MINKQVLNKLKKCCDKDELLQKNRILNKSALIDLVTNYSDNLNKYFNIEINTHGATDQKSTGRCWFYAGLNLLREKVIKKCNLDSFELSGSYLAFYEKLERFHYLMEKLEEYHGKQNEYDREIQSILKNGIEDGGNFTEFKVLVKKYGVIPKNVYSNSFNSNDTGELNNILSRLLRKYYLNINNKNVKEEYLKKVYKVLAYVYGIPNDTFDFEYKDKNGLYHIDKSITPKRFYEKYININLDNDYVEVYSYQDKKYKYNNLYNQKNNVFINVKNESIILNLEYDELEKLMIKQLKNDESVYFSSSTSIKYLDGIWIDLLDRYSSFFNIDLKLTNNEIIQTYGTQGEHSMLMTGVSICNKKVNYWKIENSWGDKEGLNGYFIAEEKFIKNNLISAVINKKYLSDKQKEILKTKPIIIDKWDYKFC